MNCFCVKQPPWALLTLSARSRTFAYGKFCLFLDVDRPCIRSVEVICAHHKAQFIDSFSKNQINCADPFGKHKHPVKNKSLRTISYEKAELINSLDNVIKHVASGMKLCSGCQHASTPSSKAASNEKTDSHSDPDFGSDFVSVTNETERKVPESTGGPQVKDNKPASKTEAFNGSIRQVC